MASAVSKGRALVSQRLQLPLLWTRTHICRAKTSVGSPEFIECARELTFPKRKWGPRALREAKAGCPPYPPNGLFCGFPEPLLRGAGSPGSGPGPLLCSQDRSLGQHTKLCAERREQLVMAGSKVAAPAHAPSSRTCPCHPGKLSPQWAVHAWLPVISGREPLRAVRGWPVHLAPCTWTVWMEGAAGDRTSGQKHHGATPTSFRVGSPPPSLSFLSPGRGPQRALGNQPRGFPPDTHSLAPGKAFT